MIDKSLGAADDLRRQVRARLSEGRVERELDGVVVVLIAHEACYALWREESKTRRDSSI